MKLNELVGDKIRWNKDLKKGQIGSCGVCGESRMCFSILGDRFTNYDKLRGRYICKECCPLFSDEWRKTAFYITENKALKIQQKDLFDLLFRGGLQYPCLVSFSESRKKHRLFRTRITTGVNEINLSVDNGESVFDGRENSPDMLIANYLNLIYNTYPISKGWILDFPTQAIAKTIGLRKYLELKEIIRPLRDQYKLNLIISFLNKDE